MRLFRGGLTELLDITAPAEIHDQVRRIARGVAGVEGIDDLRVRRSGLVYLVDIHVVADGELSVRRGHKLGHQVKDALIMSGLPILDALVHVEPDGGYGRDEGPGGERTASEP